MKKYIGTLCSFFIICLIVGMMAGVANADQNSDNSQNSQDQISNVSERAGPGIVQDQKNPKEMRSHNGTPEEMGHPPDFVNNSEFREKILSDLESKGVDTAELRAAMQSGDQEKILKLMDSFRDKLPGGPQNGTPGPKFDGKEPMGNQTKYNGPADKSGTAPSPVQSAQKSQPVPTPTKSPLSPLIVLTGIGAVGLAVAAIKRN